MAANGLVGGEKGLSVYMMCEVLSNIISAKEFAARFDGFSIGSNDLTQLVLGVDRDSEIQVFPHLKIRSRPAEEVQLELLDFACVKINEPQPWQLNLIMCRLQSINVSIIGIHPVYGDSRQRCGGCSGRWPAKADDLLDRGSAVVSSSVL
jgi:phosphoenolpyruvate synthase/pyruvate phosphate dikinase